MRYYVSVCAFLGRFVEMLFLRDLDGMKEEILEMLFIIHIMRLKVYYSISMLMHLILSLCFILLTLYQNPVVSKNGLTDGSLFGRTGTLNTRRHFFPHRLQSRSLILRLAMKIVCHTISSVENTIYNIFRTNHKKNKNKFA